MEIVVLVVVIAAIAAYYGLFNSVERAARMADRAMGDLERDQVETLAKKDANRSVDQDLFAKAVANRKLLDELARL